MDHFVSNKKGIKKKKKKKRSRSNDFGSDEYSYSILYSDPRISEYSDTRSSPIRWGVFTDRNGPERNRQEWNYRNRTDLKIHPKIHVLSVLDKQILVEKCKINIKYLLSPDRFNAKNVF